MSSLTVLLHYTLRGDPAAAAAAIEGLARRVEAEGHPGVLSYRFWLDPAQGTVRAIVDYADAGARIGHHDIAMGWPEMAAVHAAATLNDITFLGPLSPEVMAWFAASSLTARIHHGYRAIAGFRRPL